MATTTNYAWTTPDNSGLVKNGAQDIRTLGDSVDASLWNSGYGQAAKNKIINGDFAISQRGTTFTIAASGYAMDRFFYSILTAVPTGTISQQTFAPGTAPVAGYEGTSFARINQTADNGSTQMNFRQRIENVRTFAGQTATFSFWAKADAACNLTSVLATQNFGTGGSSSVSTTVTLNSVALTTAWTRYTGTVAIPTISGSTIGTSSFLEIRVNLPTSGGLSRNGTYDFWGWQLEYGSKATPFQTATGTIQGELAACQRYYWRTGGLSAFQQLGTAYAKSATEANMIIPNPVPMRTIPTSVDSSTLGFQEYGGTIRAMSSVTLDGTSSPTASFIYATIAGSTAGFVGRILVNNSTSGFLGFSAEL
jgi:hypothetical protein